MKPMIFARAAFALAAAATAAGALAAPNGSGAAINLSSLDYYSNTYATVDLMKRSSEWLTQCSTWAPGNNCSGFTDGAGSWDTKEQDKLELDADGWPKRLPDANDKAVKFRSVATVVLPAGAPAGTYVVRYDGVGKISYNGAARKLDAQSSAGRDVLQVANTDQAQTWISIDATDASNPLRNIRLYPPGGVCGTDWMSYAADASACKDKGAFLPFENFPKSQVFHPKFLSDLKGFRTLRFLDWLGPLTNPAVTWKDRTRYTYRTWSGPTRAPYRALFDLSARVQANPWITMPIHIDDNHARQFARQAVKMLGAGATLYLEYGNEPWNYAFPSSHWMKDQALKIWSPTPGTDEYMLQTNWYSKRSAEICQIVKTEFGAASDRVKCVQNAQAANAWNTDYALQCPVAAKTLGQSCDKFFDVVAVAPYFGDYINQPKLRATIATWYGEADGGVSKLFEELTGTDARGKAVTPPLAGKGSGAPKGALVQASEWMVGSAKVAKAHGLGFMAYEGGQHLVGGGDAEWAKLVSRANLDPRMGAAYDRMMADWQAAGGQTFAYFNHLGGSSQYGAWGLKRDAFDDQDAKWQSALRWRDAGCWWAGCASKP